MNKLKPYVVLLNFMSRDKDNEWDEELLLQQQWATSEEEALGKVLMRPDNLKKIKGAGESLDSLKVLEINPHRFCVSKHYQFTERPDLINCSTEEFQRYLGKVHGCGEGMILTVDDVQGLYHHMIDLNAAVEERDREIKKLKEELDAEYEQAQSYALLLSDKKEECNKLKTRLKTIESEPSWPLEVYGALPVNHGKWPNESFNECFRCRMPYTGNEETDSGVLIGRIGICEDCMTEADWEKYNRMEFTSCPPSTGTEESES